MRGAFLLSSKYGKLAETTKRDKRLGGQKIEGTKKQPHWSQGGVKGEKKKEVSG